jgi:outer membrane beta-barrel protein
MQSLLLSLAACLAAQLQAQADGQLPAADGGGGGEAAPRDIDEMEEEAAEPAPEAAPARVACLDQLSEDGYRRKGVQKRDFLKRLKLELSGVGGFQASDVISSSYTFGGGLSFYPAEDVGLELLVSYAPVRFRLEEPFSGFDRARRFLPGSALQAMAGLTFSPFHAKFKLTRATILHGDLFVVAGAGRTFHSSVQGISWQAGLGLKLYLLSRLSFRIDLRDFVLPQEVLGRGRITHNVVVLGGFSLWLG